MNAALGASILTSAFAVGSFDTSMVAAIQGVTIEPATTIQLVLPIDVVELTKAIFTGIAAVGGAFAAVYSVVGAGRAKRAETATIANSADLGAVRADVKLLERNTNSMTGTIKQLAEERGIVIGEKIGEQRGVADADKLAEGLRQGIELERASIAAANPASPDKPVPLGEGPLPVADDRTATATERIADAAEGEAKPK